MMKINAYSQAQLIKLLLDGDLNCKELAEESGLHYVTVLQYTRELHRAGASHIVRWEKDDRGRDQTRIYKLGRGKDVKRETFTAAERQRRARAKKKAMQMALVMGGAGQFVACANGRHKFEELAA